MVETKKKYRDVSLTDYPVNTWYGTNLVYWIGQGTDDHTRIGDKIRISGIRMRGTFIPSTQGSVPYCSPFQIRLVCFKSTADLSNGTTGAEFSTGITPARIGSGGLSALMDTEKIQVVFDKIYNGVANVVSNFTSGVGQFSQFPMITLDHYWKINQNLQFKGDNSGYAKGYNYYISYYVSWPGTAQTHSSQMQTAVYYKDL